MTMQKFKNCIVAWNAKGSITIVLFCLFILHTKCEILSVIYSEMTNFVPKDAGSNFPQLQFSV